ncbi:hypothetical protein D3C77_597900 [compost metagenome]
MRLVRFLRFDGAENLDDAILGILCTRWWILPRPCSIWLIGAITPGSRNGQQMNLRRISIAQRIRHRQSDIPCHAVEGGGGQVGEFGAAALVDEAL